MKLITGALLLIAAVTPASAAGCIVDYEAFVIRSALADDAGIADEQSASGQGWFVSGEPLTVIDQSYEPYGVRRVVSPGDIEFYAFRGSVPIFREAGTTGTPEVIYISVDPMACEVQPYRAAV